MTAVRYEEQNSNSHLQWPTVSSYTVTLNPLDPLLGTAQLRDYTGAYLEQKKRFEKLSQQEAGKAEVSHRHQVGPVHGPPLLAWPRARCVELLPGPTYGANETITTLFTLTERGRDKDRMHARS